MSRKPARKASRKKAPTRTRSAKPASPPDAAPIEPTLEAIDADTPPLTPTALHRFLTDMLGINVPRTALLTHSDPPMNYLIHTFFEGRIFNGDTPTDHYAPPDAVVWANRGGGKTYLGAVATMLDLVFKPGVEIRILAGSVEQARRMLDHLRTLFEHPRLAPLLDRRGVTDRRIRLTNRSRCEVLAQSHASVRGTRVQKVRCDEVELFSRELWDAAQLAVRSLRRPGPWGTMVRGSVEALSTMHRPMGLMHDIVAACADTRTEGLITGAAEETTEAAETGDQSPQDQPALKLAQEMPISETKPKDPPRRERGRATLFRWGVVDALESCTAERVCDGCALQPECAGRAKTRPPNLAGHMHIDDAITSKQRVGLEQWESEMLCLRPRRGDTVYPEFSIRRHVFNDDLAPDPLDEFTVRADAKGNPLLTVRGLKALQGSPGATLVCGMDFGIRSPTVILWALISADGVIRVIDELVATDKSTSDHIRSIKDSRWGPPVWIGVDPAGRARSEQTQQSPVMLMIKSGLVVHSRRFALTAGLRMVRARLAPAMFRVVKSDKGDGNVIARLDSSPTLYIHQSCTKLIEALTRYRYDENDPRSQDPVKDGFDHACDALRYLVQNAEAQGAQCLTYDGRSLNSAS